MTGQEVAAVAITAAAAGWLAWRWFHRGLGDPADHGSAGCGDCHHGAPGTPPAQPTAKTAADDLHGRSEKRSPPARS